MNINLKQDEIIAALKQYISHQGINTVGKNIQITFTAGYKKNGISAAILIEESELLDIVVDASALDKPTLTVVPNTEANPPSNDNTRTEAAPVVPKPTSLFS